MCSVCVSLFVSLFVSSSAGIRLLSTKKILSQNNVAEILILLEIRSVLLLSDVLNIQVMILFWQQLVLLHNLLINVRAFLTQWSSFAFKVTEIWPITCIYFTLTHDVKTL